MPTNESLKELIAKRWTTARRRAGIDQVELAAEVDRGRAMMSMIETARVFPSIEVLARAAAALNVSTDYLMGFTDDPSSSEDRAADSLDVAFLPIFTERVAAGEGGEAHIMATQSPYPFRRFRLQETGIDPEHAKVFRVVGDSMKPTLTDGDAILVDYLRTALHENRIYVLRDNGHLLVKRVRLEGRIWWWYSDNPAWEPLRHEDRFDVWGEVRWVGRQFSDSGE